MMMVSVSWLLLILVAIQSDQRKELKDFRWENRMLITQGVSLEQMNSEELEERKLLYFQFMGYTLHDTNYDGAIKESSFRKLLESQAPKNWILVGLDGGVKQTGNDTPDLGELVKIIDAMPMRQSEIRRGKKDNFLKNQ